MFNKNDPLIDSVTKVMKENQSIRDAERAVNEEFGIAGKRDLPYQFHAEYDALVEEVAKEALVGGQAKLDVNKNNRLDKHDFKMLRGMKKKPMEEGKMKDIATEKAEKERLEKMEEQQVNTAGKSDKMTSAPATATTLKPLNKPGLPKLGGMTVIQKGAMKEEAIKKERGKKVASAILAKMRAKADMEEEVVQEVLGPNPGVVKANQMTSAGQAQRYRPAPPKSDMSSMAAGRAAERGPATTAPVNKSRQDYGPPGGGPAPTKLAAPVNQVSQSQRFRPAPPKNDMSSMAAGRAAERGPAPKTAASDPVGQAQRFRPAPVVTKPPASGGRVKKPAATGVPAGMYMVKSNVKGASGLRSIKNIGGGIGGGGNK